MVASATKRYALGMQDCQAAAPENSIYVKPPVTVEVHDYIPATKPSCVATRGPDREAACGVLACMGSMTCL